MKKTPKQYADHKKLQGICISAALLYFILSVCSYFSFGESSIRIRNLGKLSDGRPNSRIYIDYIALDDVIVKPDRLQGIYTAVKDSDYSFYIDAEEQVILSVSLYSYVTIAFRRTADSATVELQDAKRIRTINLLGTDGEIVRCHPTVTLPIAWLLLIIGIVIIWGLLYAFVYLGLLRRCGYLHKICSSDFIWILFTAVSSRLYYFKYFSNTYIIGPDTYTYELYFEHKYNDIRTPVYPLLWQFARIFSEDNVYYVVVCFQIFFGCLAVWLFWKIMNQLSQKRIAVIFTVIYANLPMIIYYEHALLSDSLSVFLLLCEIRLVQKYISQPDKIKAFLVSVTASVCIMERPGYIYLIPLLLVFFIIHEVWTRSRLYSACWMVIPTAAVLLYCMYNYAAVGKFEISCVPVLYNDGYKVTVENFYDGTEYPEIEESVTKYKMEYGNNHWNFKDQAESEYGNDYTKFIKSAVSVNKNEVFLHGADKILDNFSNPIIQNNLSNNRDKEMNENQLIISDEGLHIEKIMNQAMCPFTYGMIYIFIAISVLKCLYQWIIHKCICWMLAGTSGILFCTIFSSIFNGYADFQRLTISVIPVIYFSAALWMNAEEKEGDIKAEFSKR